LSRRRSSKDEREVLVIAGEDSNDRRVVTHLIEEFCPRFAGHVLEIRDPVRLKSATGPTLTRRVQTLVNKAKARALREDAVLAGLVVHEDLDAVADTSYERVRSAIADQLTRQSPCDAALALAAWETESWLLLFPEAFPRLHSGWRLPESLRGRDTGRLNEPKELLRRRLGAPAYRESDGPSIMAEARAAGLLRKAAKTGSPSGTNSSYQDFLRELDQWA
jgi:hypothetical protein